MSHCVAAANVAEAAVLRRACNEGRLSEGSQRFNNNGEGPY